MKEINIQTYDKIIDFIIYIDYIKTIARSAHENNYIKPEIIKSDCGCIDAVNLRHPIVEKIIKHEYVPHDVKIGFNDETKGWLLYGDNCVGKSVLMKAIAIAITMAQSGFYVPATSFKFYPYKKLYTRITGNDNIFRGLSSFALELTELSAIFNRSDEYTLAVGDEVCKGTEPISGTSIIASTLIELSDKNVTFIFASHLHDILKIKDVEQRKNIKAYHLSVVRDLKTDELVYERILKDGPGDRIYGVYVAKSMIPNINFNVRSIKYVNELQNKHDGIISTETSRYNSEKLKNICEYCGKLETIVGSELETHHLNYQKDFIDGKHIDPKKMHIQKNSWSNLQILCQKCHDLYHSNKIKPIGFKMTSCGIRFIWK